MGIVTFHKQSPCSQEGASLPAILTSGISQDSFVPFITMGSVGLSAHALQTNEDFHLFLMTLVYTMRS